MKTVEVLITGDESKRGRATMLAAAAGASAAGMNARVTECFTGGSHWLCVWGAGALARDTARKKQIAHGGRVALWDVGYWGHSKDLHQTYVRVSIDHFHPQAFIGQTEPRPHRLWRHRVQLRSDYAPWGHVVVVGMGQKSREHLGEFNWEVEALESAKRRFPARRILYRPKIGSEPVAWQPQDGESVIEDVLRCASLAICRHSNVAIDACTAGVPVECEDGAAHWLYSRGPNPGPAARLDFLRRLAWWNWKLSEMAEAWTFLRRIVET